MLIGKFLAAGNNPLCHLSAVATSSFLPAILDRCISSVPFHNLATRLNVRQDLATDTKDIAAAACRISFPAQAKSKSHLHPQLGQALASAQLQPCCLLSTVGLSPWPTGRRSAVAHAEYQGSRCYVITAADDQGKESTASQDAKAITRSIRETRNIHQLADIVQQSARSFNAIHTAAAFTKAVRLQGKETQRIEPDAALLQQLAMTWQRVLHQATVREMSNCLWACARLSFYNTELWSSSISAALQQLGPKANGQDLSNIAYALALLSDSKSETFAAIGRQQAAELLGKVTGLLISLMQERGDSSVSMLSISTVLWANAKLGVVPAVTQVQVLLQGMTEQRPSAAGIPVGSEGSRITAQSMASALWAVSELQQLSGGSLNVQEAVWQQLLSSQRLQDIAAGGAYAVSNTLRALGLLATADGHTLAVPFAQECAMQLLQGPSAQNISNWWPVDIAAALTGCGKIGVKDLQFLQSLAGAAPDWLPAASAANLHQIAWACTKLRFRHPQLIQELMHKSKQLMHGNRHNGQALIPIQEDRVSLAAMLSWTVAVLNLRNLAGDVKALLVSSGIKHMQEPFSAAVARMLWRVHSWLMHQHVGGHGLTNLLTEQQLAACAASTRHSHRLMPQQQTSAAGMTGVSQLQQQQGKQLQQQQQQGNSSM